MIGVALISDSVLADFFVHICLTNTSRIAYCYKYYRLCIFIAPVMKFEASIDGTPLLQVHSRVRRHVNSRDQWEWITKTLRHVVEKFGGGGGGSIIEENTLMCERFFWRWRFVCIDWRLRGKLLRMHTAVEINKAIRSKSREAQIVIVNFPAPPEKLSAGENCILCWTFESRVICTDSIGIA